MARIRNRATGVVVTTSDEVAERLSKFEWEPAGEAKSQPKRAAKSDSK